ncbi:unnamed protein product [Amaranthus hypochondriacus]
MGFSLIHISQRSVLHLILLLLLMLMIITTSFCPLLLLAAIELILVFLAAIELIFVDYCDSWYSSVMHCGKSTGIATGDLLPPAAYRLPPTVIVCCVIAVTSSASASLMFNRSELLSFKTSRTKEANLFDIRRQLHKDLTSKSLLRIKTRIGSGRRSKYSS